MMLIRGFAVLIAAITPLTVHFYEITLRITRPYEHQIGVQQSLGSQKDSLA